MKKIVKIGNVVIGGKNPPAVQEKGTGTFLG